MSYNKAYQDCKSCTSSDEFDICKQEKQQKILLECGQGTGSKTFVSPDDTPFQIANVTIDTTCSKKPEVLIKFSSLVRTEKIENAPKTVRLKYELFRSCDAEESISLGTWIFEAIDTMGSDFSAIEESFSFIFCETSKRIGSCIYFVEVTPLEINNATVTVSTGQMAALTRGSSKSRDTLLACGQGNNGIVFTETGLRIPADIAHITIDPTLLNKPKILIEFSCLIKLAEDIEEAKLKFELFRVCDDNEPVSRGTWTFDMDPDELVSKAFSFIFCECEALSKCCNYFVKVTPIEIDDNEDNDVTVYNARMAAIAQSSEGKSDCINCKSPNAKPKEIILECGTSTGSRRFTSASEIPFQMANVTIDTTSFCKPIVNIEFSSIVSFRLENMDENTDSNTSVQLRYELFRKCDNRRPISIGVWEFQSVNDSANSLVQGTESFDFVFCDCMVYPSFCEYFVTVTAVEMLEESGVRVATVNNGRIAVLAGEAW
ncbi:DUF4489 domain-containing protein [Wukongibacter baidiensis]|uniref:DUF4489 domain-containing protein n=1 Tax=Wukongibacter baidiensis TaxID=1723361 RepID=UPI003D7F7964